MNNECTDAQPTGVTLNKREMLALRLGEINVQLRLLTEQGQALQNEQLSIAKQLNNDENDAELPAPVPLDPTL